MRFVIIIMYYMVFHTGLLIQAHFYIKICYKL